MRRVTVRLKEGQIYKFGLGKGFGWDAEKWERDAGRWEIINLTDDVVTVRWIVNPGDDPNCSPGCTSRYTREEIQRGVDQDIWRLTSEDVSQINFSGESGGSIERGDQIRSPARRPKRWYVRLWRRLLIALHIRKSDHWDLVATIVGVDEKAGELTVERKKDR